MSESPLFFYSWTLLLIFSFRTIHNFPYIILLKLILIKKLLRNIAIAKNCYFHWGFKKETFPIYLSMRVLKKKWSRCFIMKNFMCGVCTTQRIESINSILSEKLNSQSPLQEVFQFIKSREFEVNKKNWRWDLDISKQKRLENSWKFESFQISKRSSFLVHNRKNEASIWEILKFLLLNLKRITGKPIIKYLSF